MGFAAVGILSRAGEPVRPVLLAYKCRFRIATMFGIWLLERLVDLSSTVVILVLSLLLPSALLSDAGSAPVWENKLRAAAGLLIVGLTAFIAFLVYLRLHGAGLIERSLAGWRAKPGWRERFALQVGSFSEGLQAIRTFSDLLAALFYSTVHWILIILVYELVARSFSGRLAQFDIRAAMLLLIVTIVGSMVQLPGVGGGTQILSFIAFTQLFRIEQEPAAAAAIVLWLVNGATVCLVGIPLLIREGWSVTSLRQLARAEVEAEKVGSHVAVASDDQA